MSSDRTTAGRLAPNRDGRLAWSELEPILDQALELNGSARAEYLSDLLGAELAERIGRALGGEEEHPAPGDLAGVHDIARQALERLGGDSWPAARQSGEEGLGEVPDSALEHEATSPVAPQARVGRFVIERRIGSGGAADVYEAVRSEGSVRQVVAIKVGRRRVGRHWASHLRREQALLARLDHPRITRLVDFGTTDDGRPFLAMELVEGRTIIEDAEERTLDQRARCDLVLQVLDALEHAHSRLIVHRDLKPNNVLVDLAGRVKVLDFGIAHLLDEGAPTLPLDEKGDAVQVHHSQTGPTALTLRYAAPEQIRGEQIGVATDVYGAGLLLYQLVTGLEPHVDLDGAELARAVEQGMLPFGEHARERRTGLPADLLAILDKALQPTPAERYASATAFKDDLERFRQRRPVLARRQTIGYALGRFVSRYRTTVFVGALAAAALIGGAAAALWQAQRAQEERDRALLAEQVASAAQRFFLDDMLAAANPEIAGGRELTARELLHSATVALDRRRATDGPGARAIEGALRATVAESLHSLGDVDSAREQAEAAVALLEVVEETDSPRRLSEQGEAVAARLAVLLARMDTDARAPDQALAGLEPLASESARRRFPRNQRDPLSARIETELARAQLVAGRFEEAEKRVEVALGLLTAHKNAYRRELHEARSVQLRLYEHGRDNERAFEVSDVLLSETTEHFGDRHPLSARALVRHGMNLVLMRRVHEGAGVLATALGLHQEIYGEDHPATLMALRSYGNALESQGNYRDALEAYRSVHDRTIAVHGLQSLQATVAAEPQVGVLTALREFDEALQLSGQRIDRLVALGRGSSMLTFWSLTHRSRLLEAAGDHAGRLANDRRTLELGRSVAQEQETSAFYLATFAHWLLRDADSTVAEPSLALEVAELARARTSGPTESSLEVLAMAQYQLGHTEEAITTIESAIEAAGSTPRPINLERLASYLRAVGADERADQVLLSGLVESAQTIKEHERDAAVSVFLGAAFLARAEAASSVDALQQAERFYRRALRYYGASADHLAFYRHEHARASNALGAVLTQLGVFEEASELLESSLARLESDGHHRRQEVELGRRRMAEYERLGHRQAATPTE